MWVLTLLVSIIAQLLPQHHFADIPAGNYSGITWLGDNMYAIVSDKSAEDGFFVWTIDIDQATGVVKAARNEGFRSASQPNRDGEGIAFNRHTSTIFISGEADNNINEYDMNGKPTGRKIPPTPLYSQLPGNLGLEALSYNDSTHTLWTCNESGKIYIQNYNDQLEPEHCYEYSLDSPTVDKGKAQYYAHGIGTICALDDGSILLLEREFYVPRKKLGSFANCKLFHLSPEKGTKELLAQWRTSLSILKRDIANYEGMCIGPRLEDGSRVLVLVADSQDQYHGILKDWIKTIKLQFKH